MATVSVNTSFLEDESSTTVAANNINDFALLFSPALKICPHPRFILYTYCVSTCMQDALYSHGTVRWGQVRAPLPHSVLCVRGRKSQRMREHTVQVYICVGTIVLHLLFCVCVQRAPGSWLHSEWWELSYWVSQLSSWSSGSRQLSSTYKWGHVANMLL